MTYKGFLILKLILHYFKVIIHIESVTDIDLF